MRDTTLTKWLLNKGFLVVSKETRAKITHTCLDGGRLSIPKEDINDFYKIYATGVKNGEDYFICEAFDSKSGEENMKLYFDFDFCLNIPISDTQLNSFSNILKSEIDKIYNTDSNMVVCRTHPTKLTKNGEDLVKAGVHFYFPDVVVSGEEALDISKYICLKFISLFPGFPWDTIIDSKVYKVGLRMLYSKKIANKRRKIVNNADNSGVKGLDNQEDTKASKGYEIVNVIENRYYYPVMFYDQGEKIDNLCFNKMTPDDLVYFLKMCSVKCYNEEKKLDMVVKVPKYEPEKKEAGSKQTEEMAIKVEQFIRTQTIPEWNHPLVSVKKMDKIYIAKNTSMYCLNVKRDHNSCGIYFVIQESGMYQKCFCRCETTEGRKAGVCSKFKSHVFPIPMDLKKSLFSGKKSKTSQNQIFGDKYSNTKEIFGSNTLLKSYKTLPGYLKMSMNTILELEKQIAAE